MVTDAGLVPTVGFLFQAMFAAVVCSIANMGSKGHANSILYTAAIAFYLSYCRFMEMEWWLVRCPWLCGFCWF